MRNEKQEKVEDIVAEMRNEWAEVYYSEGTRRRDGAYCDNKFVAIEPSEVADRIEAAANLEREAGAEAAQICGEIGEMIGREATIEKSSQVGNAAAMREALSDACYAMFNFLKTKDGGYEEMAESLDKAKAALADPPRNCDVGTAEEQSDRFEKFCYSYNSCSKCPVKSLWNSSNRKNQLREITRCEIIWAQMPYEKGETK